MKSITRMIALLLVAVLLTIIVGCTSKGSDVGQKVAATSGSVSVAQRSNDRLQDNPATAATSTMQAAAATTEVLSPPVSQTPVATPEATATHPATPTATRTPTRAPTTTPIASATPGAARPTAATLADASALAERGIQVYQEQYCGICHQLDAVGSAGVFGPTHNGFAQTAEQRLRDPRYTGKATTAEEYVRESIQSPTLYLVGGYEHSSHRMPAYTNLSEMDLEALVQLLLQQE
jgi:mono/diheme cytochrome c family protein